MSERPLADFIHHVRLLTPGPTVVQRFTYSGSLLPSPYCPLPFPYCPLPTAHSPSPALTKSCDICYLNPGLGEHGRMRCQARRERLRIQGG